MRIFYRYSIFVVSGLALFFAFSSVSMMRVVGLRESLGVQPIWVPGEIDLGELHAGDEITVAIPVCNLSWRGLTIVGAKYACSCTAVDSLPLHIPPSATRFVLIKYRAQASVASDPISLSIRLLLNESGKSVVLKLNSFVQNDVGDVGSGEENGEE